MRIVSGKFKGRRFHPPADNWPTRPTTDFAKEGLFNILNNNFDFQELKVLDLFGGTGSHSYEFISRGCEDVTYVDKFVPAVSFVTKMAKELNVEAYLKIIRGDVFQFLKNNVRQFDYIFAGPPYAMPMIDTIPDLIFEYDMLKADGWFVMEHDPTHSYKNHPNFLQERNYSKTIFSFFENVTP